MFLLKSETMLSIENLTVSVDDKTILRGLSLDVPAGEVHAIMGPNGAGKSTLGYTLAGRPNYEVTGGSVTFNGEDLLDKDVHERRGFICRSSIRWKFPAFRP